MGHQLHSASDATKSAALLLEAMRARFRWVRKRSDRLSLLQSLVEPSAKIAKGFESVTIVLQSGQLVAGIIRNEENRITD